MRQDENTVGFNPETDIRYSIVPGVYPAHVIKFTEREIKKGTGFIYNLVYRIAEEVAELDIPLANTKGEDRHLEYVEVDGKRVTQKGVFLVGREVRDNGNFFTTKLKEGEGWKNNRYRDLCKALNVEIPVEGEVEYLGRLEDEDAIAQPCKVKVDLRTYDKKDGSGKAFTMNVTEVFRWEGGEILSDEVLDSLISENEKKGTTDVGF